MFLTIMKLTMLMMAKRRMMAKEKQHP